MTLDQARAYMRETFGIPVTDAEAGRIATLLTVPSAVVAAARRQMGAEEAGALFDVGCCDFAFRETGDE